MSVLIKGMKMPEHCGYCRFSYDGICHALQRVKYPQDMKDGKLADCPLVEIPTPHGRLIDGDALIAAYDAQHDGEPGRARKLMEEAPTIIEAEGEE